MRRPSRTVVGAEQTVAAALAELRASGARSAVVVHDGRPIGQLSARVPAPSPQDVDRLGLPEDLTAELRLAKKIQQQMLPRVVPRIPGLEVYGALRPARDVGGDYWSAKYYKADDRVTMKLADATGHGIAAALLVPAVKYISGGFYRGAASPEWVIERTNHVLVEETPVEILVSMIYAWYLPRTRELQVVNAGHVPVFLVQKKSIVDIPTTGPVLGLMETRYQSLRYVLHPGDLFFVCSDGITEARIGDQRLGDDRVKEMVLDHASAPPAEIAAAVLRACAEPGCSPEDDRSILIARAV